MDSQVLLGNPLEPSEPLKAEPSSGLLDGCPNPGSIPQEEDSAMTKAEKVERLMAEERDNDAPPVKRIKLDGDNSEALLNGIKPGDGVPAVSGLTPSERQKGVAPIKAEFLIYPPGNKYDRGATITNGSSTPLDARDQVGGKRKEKSRGQNTNRQYGSSRDEKGLCQSRATSAEFSPAECRFGEGCKFEHNLRTYLSDWKRQDLRTLDGRCPIWELKGRCDAGWKCRFVGSHSQEITTVDGRKELVLLEDKDSQKSIPRSYDGFNETGVVNVISTQTKADLMKRRIKTEKAETYLEWLEKNNEISAKQNNPKSRRSRIEDDSDDDNHRSKDDIEDTRAQYTEPPFLPSEKRRIYFGPETPVLAPLTTQGNLPFRRLCVGLGAQLTYSEMAMSLPIVQGQKSEWALMKAHETEVSPPRFSPNSVVTEYDNSKDLKFGAQIAASKPYQALKATQILSDLCPHLRVIDLNCGCPIDLIYRQGAGSALLDSQSKLEKILRGMNTVSGEIPITVKIRMGTKDGKPNALKLVDRLVYGSGDSSEICGRTSGVAAITLHGRSRQQRYTKNADWEYIANCAALIKRHNQHGDDLVDTIRETEGRDAPAVSKVYFIGNGDCYSHVDYLDHLQNSKVDSVMVARGALIKPWIFEEIEKGQYLDKCASERLAMIEQYVRYGLETWGSDEVGVGTTRRFLLEWLSFSYRYVPVGIMEHLPPRLQDRPPAWRGRNELETLLGSDNYKDWIKIRQVALTRQREANANTAI
ncbi:MAG: hypothetical protein Q9187_003772 [Circinaria calcarea]